jgi:hypothetical protein
MKFVLLVEGATEHLAIAGFLKRWLDPQLTQPVGIQTVNFRGNERLVHKIVAKAQDYLDGPDADEIVAVIGLLDLYGLDMYPPQLTSAADRHDWAVQHFEQKVGHAKFRMFLAVHEFEAWLLAHPGLLPREVQEAVPKNIGPPEQVNFTEPPAKLLDRLYRSCMKKTYKKTVYGPQLFGKLDPKTVVAKCPYLKNMLAEMLRLAKEAGC